MDDQTTRVRRWGAWSAMAPGSQNLPDMIQQGKEADLAATQDQPHGAGQTSATVARATQEAGRIGGKSKPRTPPPNIATPLPEGGRSGGSVAAPETQGGGGTTSELSASQQQRVSSIIQADRMLATQVSRIKEAIKEPEAAEGLTIQQQKEEKLGVAMAVSRSYHPSLMENAVVNRFSPVPILTAEVTTAEDAIQDLNMRMMYRDDVGVVPNSTSTTCAVGADSSKRQYFRREADNCLLWTTSDPTPYPADDGSIFPRNIGGISGRVFLDKCLLHTTLHCELPIKIDDLEMWNKLENHGPPEGYDSNRMCAFLPV